ncbi:DddA-like double-stranded DNA deaminase toxin [Saccharothrix sp. NRRL B-16348]|uniref:DddA-like double-stranded DNA deaminase toxin n=1 Tax=Saccharothrix sp. NRRL B-16348 TaxID=1415542 RepID=UPI000AAFA634|nr:DddA-like double-stranded DNA deaminase toxin [Saccharothrix sp. NRRL B-16348]
MNRIARAVLTLVVTTLAWLTLAACAGPVCACEIPSPPDGLAVAANSEEWAKNRLALLKGKHRTTGILVSASDKEGWEFNSKFNKDDDPMGLYAQGRQLFIERGLIRPEADGFAWHVEGKAAFLMNQYNVLNAVLVINHPGGPCEYVSGSGCLNLTAQAIPKGATLWVWWGDPDVEPLTVQKRPFHNPVDDPDKRKKGRR